MIFIFVLIATTFFYSNSSCDQSCKNDVEIQQQQQQQRRDVREILRDWLSDDSLGDDAPLDVFQPSPVRNADSDFCKQLNDNDEKYAKTTVGRAAAATLKLISVFDAVKELQHNQLSDEKLRRRLLFVMLNGANEGVLVEYGSDDELNCLETLANRAARLLGVSDVDMSFAKRLYSIHGLPVANGEAVLRWHGMLHLLLEQETWVWPGIEVGFSWTLGHHWHLQTVALAPKLLYVHDLLTVEQCEALRNNSVNRMYKSPVKVKILNFVLFLI